MSNSSSWSPPPTFNHASRGYWGYEVDRLIDDLKAADLAGEPLGPIIARRELSEVGFGYDSSEVDAYLATLGGAPVIAEASTPEGDVLKRAAAQQAIRQQQVERQQPAQQVPEEYVYQVLEPYVASAPPRDESQWRPPRSIEASAMLAEIHRARLMRARDKMQAGYDALEVDQFLSQLSHMIETGQPITGALQNCRLKMTRPGTTGYDVGEVDSLLDRLEVLSSQVGAASGGFPPIVGSTRTTDSGGVRLAKTPRSLAILIFVIAVFMIVLFVMTIFLSLFLPLLVR